MMRLSDELQFSSNRKHLSRYSPQSASFFSKKPSSFAHCIFMTPSAFVIRFISKLLAVLALSRTLVSARSYRNLQFKHCNIERRPSSPYLSVFLIRHLWLVKNSKNVSTLFKTFKVGAMHANFSSSIFPSVPSLLTDSKPNSNFYRIIGSYSPEIKHAIFS